MILEAGKQLPFADADYQKTNLFATVLTEGILNMTQ